MKRRNFLALLGGAAATGPKAVAEAATPEIAALRSVSLVSKIRISRRIRFERDEAMQMTYLEGVIKGLWD